MIKKNLLNLNIIIWNQKLLKKDPMLLLWKQVKHITGAPADKVPTNHFAVARTKAPSLHR